MGLGRYDTWRELSWRPYEMIGLTSLSRYLFVLTGKATPAKEATHASRCRRFSCDRCDLQQGRGSARGKSLGGEAENWRPSEINTAPELSERTGEHPPGARKETDDSGGSLVGGSARRPSWEPLRRNSSSRFTLGYGE